jgi:hypothetical protein
MTCLPGLDIYPLLTVDLLHEVELGVWKSLFTHLIRILTSYAGTKGINELDNRFSTVHKLSLAIANI